MKKLLLAFALLLVPTASASQPPEEQETTSVFALYAETDNGASEVVIYSNFYTLTTDESDLVDEIYASLQVDTSEAEADFTVEESQFALNEEDLWWVEAGIDEDNGITEAGLELHFYVDSEDPDVLLEAALDRLEEISYEDVEERISVYTKENADSSIYGVVIISDLFGEGMAFSDVSTSHLYYDAIAYVETYGIVEGYEDGTYRPENEINRAEFTKILIEAKFPGQATAGDDCFTDVPTNTWYSKYVCFAKDQGIISGYDDGSFKPAQSINLAEALKITLETYFDDIPESGSVWYEKYWDYADSLGLILDEWESPSENLSRGAMAEVIYRIEN